MAYSIETIKFLKALKRNNKREWFNKNKPKYEEYIKVASLEFLQNLAPLMLKEFPNILVTKKSMYRIYRDSRFSKNKDPYKTHVGFLFYDRRYGKDDSPAFYFGFDPTGFAYGFGMYRFTPLQRAKFREQVVSERAGEEFGRIVKNLKKLKYETRGKELKKIPPGFDPGHSNAEFLQYNGFFVVKETDLTKNFTSNKFAQDVFKEFQKSKELYHWMLEWSRVRNF